MMLTVDPADATPPYEQLRRQLRELVAAGQLRLGDRLPSVRQLAADLGLAAGTVARTYRELEAEGLLETRRGAGTRVAARPTPTDLLADLATAFVERATALGYGAAEIRAAVAKAAV